MRNHRVRKAQHYDFLRLHKEKWKKADRKSRLSGWELHLKDGKRSKQSWVPSAWCFDISTSGMLTPWASLILIACLRGHPWLALVFWRGIWDAQSFNNQPRISQLVKPRWKFTLCGYQGNALQDSLVLLGQDRMRQESTPCSGLELCLKRCTCDLSLSHSRRTSDSPLLTDSSDSSRNFL